MSLLQSDNVEIQVNSPNIMKEVEFNLKNGIKNISFVTEDVLLYGARGRRLNSDAVKKLFKSAVDLAKKHGV